MRFTGSTLSTAPPTNASHQQPVEEGASRKACESAHDLPVRPAMPSAAAPISTGHGEHARADEAQREQHLGVAPGQRPQRARRLGGVLDVPCTVGAHGGRGDDDDGEGHQLRQQHAERDVQPLDALLEPTHRAGKRRSGGAWSPPSGSARSSSMRWPLCHMNR